MMKKIISAGLLFLLLFTSTSPILSIHSLSPKKGSIYFSEKNYVVINIAILDSLIPSFTSPNEMEEILNKYSWDSKSASYEFKTQWLTDFEIASGILRKNFDVLVIPGIGKEFRRPMDDKWKKEIRDFVENGGGYFGTCGGANLASLGLVGAKQRGWEKETPWEYFMNKSAIGIAPVKAYQDMADPVACSLIYKNPSRIGQSAYIWYNLSIEGCGVCQHCKINKNHPIFHRVDRDKRIIRWVGGPALLPLNENVTILAWYPNENISGLNGNESTLLHAWRYVGHDFNEIQDFWDMDGILETHLAGKPSAIACDYGKGRVVIFGNHPEHPVWKEGRIVEKDTNSNHMLLKGLFHWEGREMLPPSYNWWIVRRSVAWVAGVPDNELPPIGE